MTATAIPRPFSAVAVQQGAQLEVSVERITPELASRWLERNSRNREINRAFVYQLADAILRGEWQLNGQTIVFDSDGELADGQNRLKAIAKAGVPVWSVIVRGVAPVVAQDTMDGGRKRTLAHQLKMHGEKNAAVLASSICMAFSIDARGTGGHSRLDYPTVPQAIAWLEANPGIRDAQPVGRALRHTLRYPEGLGNALCFLFRQVDTDDADEFFRVLVSGEGLEDGNPLLTLRRSLEVDAARRHERMGLTYKAAITIKAWNAWRRGETLKQLKWRPGGASKEGFPQYDAPIG